jgi:cyclic pyranopterin phosphate synthase
VRFPRAAFDALAAAGFSTAKGSVIHTAIIAGTMAAKRTHELIPFCHPVGLERCDIAIHAAGGDALSVECTAAVHHRTGVEMEALTGASIAALTVYDMCKSLSHGIVIESLRLVDKSGGKSDYAAGAAP